MRRVSQVYKIKLVEAVRARYAAVVGSGTDLRIIGLAVDQVRPERVVRCLRWGQGLLAVLGIHQNPERKPLFAGLAGSAEGVLTQFLEYGKQNGTQDRDHHDHGQHLNSRKAILAVHSSCLSVTHGAGHRPARSEAKPVLRERRTVQRYPRSRRHGRPAGRRAAARQHEAGQ